LLRGYGEREIGLIGSEEELGRVILWGEGLMGEGELRWRRFGGKCGRVGGGIIFIVRKEEGGRD
jgi:hypothetical protein